MNETIQLKVFKMYTLMKIQKDQDVEPIQFQQSVAQALFDPENTYQRLSVTCCKAFFLTKKDVSFDAVKNEPEILKSHVSAKFSLGYGDPYCFQTFCNYDFE
ncbi:hypothetical protein QVD17_16871 [Tagetes erecta]|uniref:Uncharacterized protein n=1 Tax=Tagetes erecta TaxID=13708 RepID=A0AAD8P0Y5_TARER|nr:hypothetical protein QVD17_16871 [Tagetes erecta]